MAQPRSGKPLKPLINESRYPYVVELAIPETGLEIELNRQIVGFHKSQRIQPRYGRRIMRDNQTYSRWCFSDLLTARAFVESVLQNNWQLTYAGPRTHQIFLPFRHYACPPLLPAALVKELDAAFANISRSQSTKFHYCFLGSL